MGYKSATLGNGPLFTEERYGDQDANTAVRFFRKSIAEAGNPYGICGEKITFWGEGAGGYIALAASTLDDYYQDLILPGKFFTQTVPSFPMVVEAVNGDIWGTTVGVSPGSPFPYPAGDTLCVPNHPGYSSDVALCVNTGGALAIRFGWMIYRNGMASGTYVARIRFDKGVVAKKLIFE